MLTPPPPSSLLDKGLDKVSNTFFHITFVNIKPQSYTLKLQNSTIFFKGPKQHITEHKSLGLNPPRIYHGHVCPFNNNSLVTLALLKSDEVFGRSLGILCERLLEVGYPRLCCRHWRCSELVYGCFRWIRELEKNRFTNKRYIISHLRGILHILADSLQTYYITMSFTSFITMKCYKMQLRSTQTIFCSI